MVRCFKRMVLFRVVQGWEFFCMFSFYENIITYFFVFSDLKQKSKRWEAAAVNTLRSRKNELREQIADLHRQVFIYILLNLNYFIYI
jgi:hypothetical protein